MAMLRALQDANDYEEDSDFEPKVFWSVNAFIFFLVVFGCTWWWRSLRTEVSNPRNSDEVYRQTVQRRREAREEARKENPETRQRHLLGSFQRRNVSMTVEETDLIPPDETEETTPDDVEAPTGSLRLRLEDGKTTTVPNCCAICLGDYQVGETVVWSSNECPHAFHRECIIDWLTKMQEGTPCPCCRQDFTDLDEYRRQRRITWRAGATFHPGSIVLR